MIWRFGEGDRLHYGLNWARDARTPLALIVCWRGWSYIYGVGFRLRPRQAGRPMFIPRMFRGCLRCDPRLGVFCARHDRQRWAALQKAMRTCK